MSTGMDAREVAQALQAELDGAQRALTKELSGLRLIQAEVPDAVLVRSLWLSSEARRMCEVELESVQGSCEPRHDDPVTVYARPSFRVGELRVHFDKDYEVAVSVPGRVVPSATWSVQMRADGLSDAVIRACAAELIALDARESQRRRFDESTGSTRPRTCDGETR